MLQIYDASRSNVLFLFKKKDEKTKKWKPYWFSLNQNDKQLFYFSNEKVNQSKNKCIFHIDLGILRAKFYFFLFSAYERERPHRPELRSVLSIRRLIF